MRRSLFGTLCVSVFALYCRALNRRSFAMSTFAAVPLKIDSLRSKSVFVTGGATGIGAAIVEAFAQQQCNVAFVDVDDGAAGALAKRLSDQTRVWWRRCDVRDVPALQACIRDAAKELGDFSVLVNNVANDERHELLSVTPEYWDERMAINQRPAFFAIQAVVPGLRKQGGGSIINVGSGGWQIKESGYP